MGQSFSQRLTDRHAEPVKGAFDQHPRAAANHESCRGDIDRRESLACECAGERLLNIRSRIGQGSVEVEYDRTVTTRNHATSRVLVLLAAIMRLSIGMRISSIASSILAPGTTIVLRREINESLIIASRKGKSISNLAGSRKRITIKLSSGVGTSRAMNGLDVSTVGTR